MRKLVVALAVLGVAVLSATSAEAGAVNRADFDSCGGTVTTSRGTARNIRVYKMSCKKGKRIIRNPSGGKGVGQVICLMGEPKHGGYLFSCTSETGTVRFLFNYNDGRSAAGRGATHKCHGDVGDSLGGWTRIRATRLPCRQAKKVLASFLHSTS